MICPTCGWDADRLFTSRDGTELCLACVSALVDLATSEPEPDVLRVLDRIDRYVGGDIA